MSKTTFHAYWTNNNKQADMEAGTYATLTAAKAGLAAALREFLDDITEAKQRVKLLLGCFEIVARSEDGEQQVYRMSAAHVHSHGSGQPTTFSVHWHAFSGGEEEILAGPFETQDAAMAALPTALDSMLDCCSGERHRRRILMGSMRVFEDCDDYEKPWMMQVYSVFAGDLAKHTAQLRN